MKFTKENKIEMATDVRTHMPHIWSIGDTTVDIALVNVAEIEGRHCIDTMFGGKTEPMSYENISNIIFVDPKVAAVGANEQTLQRKKIPYKVSCYSYELVSRAIAMGQTEGFVKLIVSNDEKMQILGIRALGAHASSVIDIVSLMIRLGKSINEISDLITAYPAVTEGLLECVRMLYNASIMKPQAFDCLKVIEVTYDANGKPVYSSPFPRHHHK
eukprot:TRINITY_DN4282_c0_g1_i1.p1 TRINITY_DN4282_c0_g1~~TRINITY_DN4282_c0_g1_i1.p1  ORF type:complete len:215 (-),score=38.83 TRINITY_DN4282_c0_g1_i1:25-669(-)